MLYLLTNERNGTWGFNRKLYKTGRYVVRDDSSVIVEAVKRAPLGVTIRPLTDKETRRIGDIGFGASIRVEDPKATLIEGKPEPELGASPKVLAKFYEEHPEIKAEDEAKRLAEKAGVDEGEVVDKEPSEQEPFVAETEPVIPMVSTDELLIEPKSKSKSARIAKTKKTEVSNVKKISSYTT